MELCLQPNRRRPRESLAALQDRARVKGITPIRVISFCLLAACGGLCQSENASPGLLQGNGLHSPEVQPLVVIGAQKSLPDAPSVQAPTEAEQFHSFVGEARSPFTFGAVRANGSLMREREPGHVTSRSRPSFTILYRAASVKKESTTFFDNYLYPSLLKQKLRYHPSTSCSFMGRAAYAAAHIFITRDESGKGQVNSSYFLGVLTSVAVHTAYRPYWARSPSATFSNFGSTIGSDAGGNLFHEFWPGIQHLVKGYTPKFVSKIEERITSDQTPRNPVLTPVR